MTLVAWAIGVLLATYTCGWFAYLVIMCWPVAVRETVNYWRWMLWIEGHK